MTKYVPFNNVLMKSFNNTEQKSMEKKFLYISTYPAPLKIKEQWRNFLLIQFRKPKIRAPITNHTHPLLQALIKGTLASGWLYLRPSIQTLRLHQYSIHKSDHVRLAADTFAASVNYSFLSFPILHGKGKDTAEGKFNCLFYYIPNNMIFFFHWTIKR